MSFFGSTVDGCGVRQNRSTLAGLHAGERRRESHEARRSDSYAVYIVTHPVFVSQADENCVLPFLLVVSGASTEDRVFRMVRVSMISIANSHFW